MTRLPPDAAVPAPGGVLPLPASLDLGGAEALWRSLREQLDGGALLLDGGAVERVSTPALQVLAAGAIAARASGIPFRLRDASPVLADAIADLGLAATILEDE